MANTQECFHGSLWHCHHVAPNRRWQIINKCACVCVWGGGRQHWLVCMSLFCHELLFFPGAIFTLPCQPFHTELGHEGSEFRSGCGAFMQLRTLLLMQSEETSEWLNPQDIPTWKRSQGWKLPNMHGKIYPSPFVLLGNHLILVQKPPPQPLLCKWDARMVISGW